MTAVGTVPAHWMVTRTRRPLPRNSTLAVAAGPRSTSLTVKPWAGLHATMKALPLSQWATTVPPGEENVSSAPTAGGGAAGGFVVGAGAGAGAPPGEPPP